ncbi:vacuolar membrane protein-domain-containing protein [Mycena metata]|uniref:Vacuolar membrane protein-domain-containing protein n=1 Tax=Mycena metata TaxID=1033252 RepID=A0AAD7MNF4_9AGAR|nr:vacuolar membrane protein-domain-containing protein [Mycena metata]KAJ7741034.1 vacuolar membrane protein-domain-containing protein [Mycena metata]
MDDLDLPGSNISSGASSSLVSPEGDQSCELLGPIALTVQGLMGVLVILSLVYKRHREKPMRPWRIWLFDVSKQIAGQMFVHGVNVLISDLVSHHSSNNACVFYFLNILIDTTLGVGLIYVVLRVLTFIMSEKLHLKGFESGIYGNPPSIKYWMRQAAIYVMALTTMKFMVIGLLALLPGLFTLGAWLLSWTWTGEGDWLQVVFTMGIFPICMNIIQFWLIDSIVKASGVALDLDSPDPLDREPLFGAPDDDEDDDTARGRGFHVDHDVESHPRSTRSLSPSSGRSRSSDKLRTPLDPKLSGTSTPAQSINVHAYPPSIASSASSSSSSPPQAPVLREATKLKPKRRSPPSPIHIRNNNPAAVNSPRPGPTPKTAPVSAPVPPPAPEPVPPPEEEAWAESWDETDDWADKVGEEDWTGRRLEEKKSVLSGWDNGSPMVNSVHTIKT